MDSLSKDELHSISKALKNQDFRNLLVEYAEDLKDPENRRRYEEEITELEKQRGRQVQFIHPEPGFCVKAHTGEDQAVYINMCSNKNIQKPSLKKEKTTPTGGTWTIPHSLFRPKAGIFKNNKKYTTFDVVFHPDAISLSRNYMFKQMAIQVAVDGINKSFNQTINQKTVRIMKIPYKGTPTASIINKDGSNLHLDPPTVDEIIPQLKTPKVSPVKQPHYEIKYRSTVELKDYDKFSTTADRSRPKELQVIVHLPGVDNAGEVEFEVFERHALLTAPPPHNYNLEIPLKHSVDEEAGSAVFDKTTKKLIVTLPIIYNDPPKDYMSIMEDVETSPVEEFQPSPSHVGLSEEVTSKINEKEHWPNCQLAPFDCRVEETTLHVLLKVAGISHDSIWATESDGQFISLHFTSFGEGGFPMHYGLSLSLEWVSSLSFTTDLTADNLLLTVEFTPKPGIRRLLRYGVELDSLNYVCSPPSFEKLESLPDDEDFVVKEVGQNKMSVIRNDLVNGILRIRSVSEVETFPNKREKTVSFCSSTRQLCYNTKSSVSQLFAPKLSRKERRRNKQSVGNNIVSTPLNDVSDDENLSALEPLHTLTTNIVFELDNE